MDKLPPLVFTKGTHFESSGNPFPYGEKGGTCLSSFGENESDEFDSNALTPELGEGFLRFLVPQTPFP